MTKRNPQTMPLTDYHIEIEHARLGLWHITEGEDFFLKKLPLSEADRAELKPLRGNRRLEWLAARYLVQVMTGWAYSLVKDVFGKPFLMGSEYHISVSHSGEYTAAIIAPHVVGIDIQLLTTKLEGMAWRVMNETKLKNLSHEKRSEHLHVYWGAKEALYKAYGQKELHFKKNILVEPFNYVGDEGFSHGTILKENLKRDFDIFYKKIEQYILVYAIEKDESGQVPSAVSH